MIKILTVDDSTSMRQMIIATLTEAGFSTSEAENGEQGLLQAKSMQFDLIISDINMPVMNGIEMVKSLRKLPNYQFIPILVITTEDAPETKMQGKAAGATGWILKPFDPQQLISIIKKVLGK